MSFGYLSWPVYVLLALGVATIVFTYVKKAPKNQPKSFVLGLILIGIGAIIAGIHKLTDESAVLEQYLWILKAITLLCTLLGVVLLFVGAYNKVKFDSYRKRLVLTIVFVLLAIVLICGLLIAYSYYR